MDNIFLKVVKQPEKIVYGLERKGLIRLAFRKRLYKNHIQIGVWT